MMQTMKKCVLVGAFLEQNLALGLKLKQAAKSEQDTMKEKRFVLQSDMHWNKFGEPVEKAQPSFWRTVTHHVKCKKGDNDKGIIVSSEVYGSQFKTRFKVKMDKYYGAGELFNKNPEYNLNDWQNNKEGIVYVKAEDILIVEKDDDFEQLQKELVRWYKDLINPEHMDSKVPKEKLFVQPVAPKQNEFDFEGEVLHIQAKVKTEKLNYLLAHLLSRCWSTELVIEPEGDGYERKLGGKDSDDAYEPVSPKQQELHVQLYKRQDAVIRDTNMGALYKLNCINDDEQIQKWEVDHLQASLPTQIRKWLCLAQRNQICIALVKAIEPRLV